MSEWRKSSACTGTATCVEIKNLPDGSVALRDGKDPDGPIYTFTKEQWELTMVGAKRGDYDLGDSQP